jgi:hypothetical protein
MSWQNGKFTDRIIRLGMIQGGRHAGQSRGPAIVNAGAHKAFTRNFF